MAILLKPLIAAVTPLPSDFWGQPVYRAVDGTLQCPGFTGPTFATNPWDKVKLGVQLFGPDIGPSNEPFTPGLAEVSVQKARALDKRKQAGTDGTRLTIHGVEAANVEIRLVLWTPEQYEKLKTIWMILFPPVQKVKVERVSGGKGARSFAEKALDVLPYDIGHPVTDLHQIKSVLFYGGEGPVPGPFSRSRLFTMRAVEFLPPGKTATKTPDSAKASGSALGGKDTTPGSDPANTGPKARK